MQVPTIQAQASQLQGSASGVPPQFAAPISSAPAAGGQRSGGVAGRAKIWMILAIVFIVTTLAAAGFATWSFVNYRDQKDNVDAKVSTAVAAAVNEQAKKDDADQLEKDKQPNRQFAGPDDYGHLTFDYPKTWSVYLANDASDGGTFEAYLSPVVVPAVSDDERYALRVTIEDEDYDKVVDSYNKSVSDNDLKATAFKLNDTVTGTRLDGNFSKDIRGSAVIFKIRDKTVTLRTDADTFSDDFNKLIQTIAFNS